MALRRFCRRGLRRAGGLLVVAGLAVMLTAGGSGTARAGAGLPDARAVVEAVAANGIQDILTADVPHAEKINRFRSLFDTYFDLPAIGRFVLGPYWRAASPDEQARFLDLFREVNIYTWARRFKDYNGQALVIRDATADGDKGAFVESQVNLEGDQPPLTVRWRLRARPDSSLGYQVVDLEVSGVSMAITYRSEYGSVIGQHGGSLTGLNDVLAKQLEKLKTEQPG